MKAINLSPSFLSRLYSKGYDYAIGEKIGLIEKKDSVSMSNGRLMHALIAERFGGEPAKVITNPYSSFRTKEAREWRDSQPDDIAIVSQDEIDLLTKIADRVVKHPKVAKLLSGKVTPEQIIEKKVNGFNVKGILDVVSKDVATTVIDWKFVNSASFDNFHKEALWSNYDLQAAVYDFLTDATHVYFGAIENEAPYRIKLFYCDESFLISGADKFNKAFKVLEKENWREPNFDIEEVTDLVDWNNFNG